MTDRTLEPACPDTATALANCLVAEMLNFIAEWPESVRYTTCLCGLILLLEGTVKDIEDRSEDRQQRWRDAVVSTLIARWNL
jgi:hypothetical protein